MAKARTIRVWDIPVINDVETANDTSVLLWAMWDGKESSLDKVIKDVIYKLAYDYAPIANKVLDPSKGTIAVRQFTSLTFTVKEEAGYYDKTLIDVEKQNVVLRIWTAEAIRDRQKRVGFAVLRKEHPEYIGK